MTVGWGIRSIGLSVKLSVFTSRHPPQSFEYRSNSDLIHSRAAPIPCPAAIEAGSCAERVRRVPKLTSFSILPWIRSAKTCFSAAAICGSVSILNSCAFAGTAIRVKSAHRRNPQKIQEPRRPRRFGTVQFLRLMTHLLQELGSLTIGQVIWSNRFGRNIGSKHLTSG